jgi:hypothetical protein
MKAKSGMVEVRVRNAVEALNKMIIISIEIKSKQTKKYIKHDRSSRQARRSPKGGRMQRMQPLWSGVEERKKCIP